MKNITLKMRALSACAFNLCGVLWIMMIIGGLQFLVSVYAYADSSLSLADNIKKINLVQKAMDKPDSLSEWSRHDLEILLKNPQINHDENIVQAWYYHGESCALDIYFEKDADRPSYVEYRPFTLNHDIQAQYQSTDTNTMKLYCLKDVLEEQGVDTPASYARQPLPSWDNPYRT